MRNLGARISANLVWLVLFTLGVLAGAFLSFASGVLFDDSYNVSIPLPEAGGVLPGQEVTVMGRSVGLVEGVDITQDGVIVTLSIDGDQVVPANGRVQVLRRSPIGEQAVDFRPPGPNWAAAEPGATIQPDEIKVPAKVPFLLEETRDLFAAVDLDDVTTVVHELALMLDGRADRLKQLNRDSLDLGETLVEGIPEFQRLIDSSEPVLETLRDHRQALAEGFTNAAELTEILIEQRPNVDTLIDTGRRTLVQADALVRNERANISCLVGDVQGLNDMLLGPSTATGQPTRFYETKLDELEMALVKNQGFFHGFDIVTQHDPDTGVIWNRILFTSDPARGQPYPEKRATPATRPGAACVTEQWGTGVNAVRQADPQPPDPTSPGIDYAPLVEETGPEPVEPPTDNRPPLPATGGGAAIAALALGLGAWLRRRP